MLNSLEREREREDERVKTREIVFTFKLKKGGN
jgi:hypothetical protein